MKNKIRKVMVVCSDVSDALETCLASNGWAVTRVYDAKTAIAKVRRERFDLAVLVSTGAEMDITETLFNLRDIRQSLPIAVVQPTGELDDTPSRTAYLPADNNLITVQDLADLVPLLQAHASWALSQPSPDRPQL